MTTIFFYTLAVIAVERFGRPFRTFKYAIFAVLILIAKLILTSQSEIASSQFDAWSYVNLAADPSPWFKFGPAPGYSYWLWLVHESGIPQRIAIEVLYCVSALIFALGLGAGLAGFFGFVAVSTVVIFSPVAFFLFDQALSDGFFACLLLLSTGLIGLALLHPAGAARRICILLVGALLGYMEITRKETPVTVIVFLCMFAAFTFNARGTGDSSRWNIRRLVNKPLIAMVAVCLSIVLGTLVLHYSSGKVWATSIAEIPSHMAMLERLASIDTKGESHRFVPISLEAREQAYLNSPTLRKLKPFVEDANSEYMVTSVRNIGLPGEIGAGWIWHVFNSASGELGIHSPAALDETYRQINRELDDAFASGKLQRHFVLHPLLGAHLSVWLPAVPSSLVRVLTAAHQTEVAQTDAGFDSELFDRICLRRTDLVPDLLATLRGWAFDTSGEEVTVTAFGHKLDKEKSAIGFPTTRVEREDVKAGYARIGVSLPADTGFVSRIPVVQTQDFTLFFQTADDRTARVSAPSANVVQRVKLSDSDAEIVFALDTLPVALSKYVNQWRARSMKELSVAYRNTLSWYLAVPVVVALLVLLVLQARSRDFLATERLAMVCVLLAWMAGRVALYTVIDAAGWAAEPRYVESVGILFTGLVAAGAAFILKEWLRSISDP